MPATVTAPAASVVASSPATCANRSSVAVQCIHLSMSSRSNTDSSSAARGDCRPMPTCEVMTPLVRSARMYALRRLTNMASGLNAGGGGIFSPPV